MTLEDALLGDSFAALLEATKAAVEAELEAGWRSVCVGDGHGMLEAARDLTMRGGKRYRAALVVLGYQTGERGIPWKPAIVAGAAFELLQTYLLIQDDWMDGDRLRRGGPTVHAALADAANDSHLGASLAILASDYVLSMALSTVASATDSPEKNLRALRTMLDVNRAVVLGQALDMTGHEDVNEVHDLKTATYTTEGPLRVGASLAGAAPETRALLDVYARDLGRAFQVRDDLLGTFGSAEATGKPVGRDVAAGKITSLVQVGRELLRGADRDAFERAHGNANATLEEIAAAAKALENCGARAAVETRLQREIVSAKKMARAFPVSPNVRRLFEGAAEVLAWP